MTDSKNNVHSNGANQTLNLGNPVQLMSRFYQQVVQIKRWIDEDYLAETVKAQLKLDRMPSNQELAEATSLRLQRWLEKVRKNANKILTELECARVDEALYVMAALADEIFIVELDWLGKDHWEDVLLEQKVFNSSYAGEKVIRGALDLINTRTLDVQQQQLVAVYLLALRMGFSGRLRGDVRRLSRVREQLFKRISVGDSNGDLTKVCPESYEHVLASRQEQRLAPLAGWYRMLVWGSAAYLFIGWIIWVSFQWRP